MGKVKRYGLIFDAHFPYVDRRAYDLALSVLTDMKLTGFIFGGDAADAYNFSSHDKLPSVQEKAEDEIESVIGELSLVDKLFPKAEKVFLEGNHCTRLERYIIKRCPEIAGIVNIQRLLKLADMGYLFVPYGPNQTYKIGTLNVRHEPIGGGENFASSTVKKAGASVMFGHNHKIQEFQTVTLDGSYHRAISVGCMCDKNHPVMGYVKFHHQWQLGFAVVTLLDDGKTWFSQNIHILPGKQYRCMVDGKIYKN